MTIDEEIKEEVLNEIEIKGKPYLHCYSHKLTIREMVDIAIQKTRQKMEKTHISLKLHKAMQDENFEQRKQIIDLTNKLSKAKAEDRKEFAEWIEDMSCHDAPNLCQCCQDINEKLQKEVKQ